MGIKKYLFSGTVLCFTNKEQVVVLSDARVGVMIWRFMVWVLLCKFNMMSSCIHNKSVSTQQNQCPFCLTKKKNFQQRPITHIVFIFSDRIRKLFFSEENATIMICTQPNHSLYKHMFCKPMLTSNFEMILIFDVHRLTFQKNMDLNNFLSTKICIA